MLRKLLAILAVIMLVATAPLYSSSYYPWWVAGVVVSLLAFMIVFSTADVITGNTPLAAGAGWLAGLILYLLLAGIVELYAIARPVYAPILLIPGEYGALEYGMAVGVFGYNTILAAIAIFGWFISESYAEFKVARATKQ
ncbi:MAG: hypothetical protein JZD41_03680 [Thermoproteus sp.]|nr:hypothetical protein [Thermoproteus sp.]